MTTLKDVSASEIPLNVSYLAPVGQAGGKLDLQTTVPQDTSDEALAVLMDKLHKAGRRLALWAKLEENENQYEHQDSVELASMVTVNSLKEKVSGPKALTDDKNAINQAYRNIDSASATKAKLAATIRSVKKELGVE